MGEEQITREAGERSKPAAAAGSVCLSVEAGGDLLEARLLDPPRRVGMIGSLDRFEVLKIIGAGGMGVVVLAVDPQTGKRVAIKLMRPELARDARATHRFLAEARHMADLLHPNVLPVQEVSDRREGPYFVMPCMEGGSLAGLIRGGKALDPAQSLRIARGIAEALKFAHQKGITHRDLKPDNVLLDEDGNAYLGDFGLARTVFNDPAMDIRGSHIEGTAPYMPPEVARGEAGDTRCDIYSWGAMVYEMLAGAPPFGGRSLDEVLSKVRSGPPLPIQTRNPDAPVGLAAVAHGAMARELRDRYASMSDVVDDLELIEQGKPPLGPGAQPEKRPPPPARRAGFTLARRIAVVGLAATLCAVLLQALGALTGLENWLYDLRVRHCQLARPSSPAPALVHLDIDDSSVEHVNRWPMPRERLAWAIGELGHAGASALALDLLFDQPQGAADLPSSSSPIEVGVIQVPWNTLGGQFGPLPGLSTAATRASTSQATGFDSIVTGARGPDRELALAICDFRQSSGAVARPVVVAVSLRWQRAGDDALTRQEMRRRLERAPDMSLEQLAASLKRDGIGGGDVDKLVAQEFLVIRRKVLLEQVLNSAGRGAPVAGDPLAVLRAKLFDKADAIRQLQSRPAWSRSPRDVPGLLVGEEEHVPVAVLAASASSAGFADYLPEADGVVRRVPLLVSYRDQMVPQLGLALACEVLGVDPGNRMQFDLSTPGKLILNPPAGRQIAIPLHAIDSRETGGRVWAMFQIPWSGSSDWTNMLAADQKAARAQHVPFKTPLLLAERRVQWARDIDLVRQISAGPGEPLNPWALDAALIGKTLAQAKDQLDSIASLTPQHLQQMTKDERNRQEALVDAAKRLDIAQKDWKSFETAERQFQAMVKGKPVIIGWAATGASSDLITTPLHARCPGSVVHGVVFSAIMGGERWTVSPRWLTYALAVALGLAMTGLLLWLSPWRATAAGAVLIGAYLAINGLWWFDRGDWIVNAAAPATAAALVWAAVVIAQGAQRFRVIQSLRGYVEPELVEYLTTHSTRDTFEPRTREMTVVFADLAGFSEVSQKMRERSMPLLSRCVSRMVSVIRKNRGVLSKVMGEGMMYFFGAPREDAKHAPRALETALEMLDEMRRFNQSRAADQPELELHCAVSTGLTVVGDAGLASVRDYTVLGDAVNLAGRLLAISDLLGAPVVVSQQTVDRAGDEFLFQPLGKIQLRGRGTCVTVHQLVARGHQATCAQRELAQAMHGMLIAYQQGVFAGCIELADAIEKKFGPVRVCELYSDRSRKYAAQGAPERFMGQFVIGE